MANGAVNSLLCTTTAVPLMMHAEEITEPMGELRIDCTGGPPSAAIVENVTIQTNLEITNRIDAQSVSDALFTADSGSGFVAVDKAGVLKSAHTVVWNGVHLTMSPQGTVALRFSNIRVNATEASPSPGGNVLASLVVSGTIIEVNQASLLLGTTYSSLYSNQSSVLVCTQTGAKVPDGLSFSSFLAGHAAFASTRLTEGFASVLAPKGDGQNYMADSGHRVLVRYTGLSPAATLYVPVAVAGSDAVIPTSAGDFGLDPSGGKYQSSTGGGSLLLSLVHGADANGAGGHPLFIPPTPPAAPVVLDTLAEIPVAADGSASIVYEVMDSSDTTMEVAQFPTFLSVPPSGSGITYISTEQVMPAPVSSVATASTTAPVPRFVQTLAPNDCPVVGDCDAIYFPHLAVSATSLDFTVTAGSTATQTLKIINTGQGAMDWSSTIVYDNGSGSGWLKMSPANWTSGVTANVTVDATNLQPSTVNATILIDAGQIGGTVPVTINVTVEPSPGPSIRSITSSANFSGPITAGSLATIMGSGFAAPTTVTFDGINAELLYTSNRQINMLVPASLAGHLTTQIVVWNDGVPMDPVSVLLAPFSPGIFPGAVLNQDYSVNSAGQPAGPNTAIQIFGTGIASGGVITGRVSGVSYLPEYAGPAPGLDGVQQVNLRIPSNQPAGTYFLQICEAGAIPVVCSPPVWLAVGP